MRALLWNVAVLTSVVTWSVPTPAQINDAERAAARDLFRQGDELQRAGRFAEALDRFQRAEEAYSAPTNMLRIAQCRAAIGRLVESAESYRTVVHMVLSPGAPPAFQAAVNQAKSELAQIEPRVPKLVVQLAPAGAANPHLQIDGQNVTASLLGEPMPLDPGTHRVRVGAAGFTTSEQDAVLKERETTTIVATLRPSGPPVAAPLPALPPTPSGVSPGPNAPPTPVEPVIAAPPPYAVPPPPPAFPDREVGSLRKPSQSALLLGAHLGWEIVWGRLPLTNAPPVDTNTVASGGVAYALDAGLRFARHWYIGATLEHAAFSHADLTSLGWSDASSSTTLLGGTFAFIGNPDRTSFYGELGAGARWFTLSQTDAAGKMMTNTTNYNAGELTLGLGVWLALGPSFRLLPKATIGVGAFGDPSGSSTVEGHGFAMFGVTGFYNRDL